MKKLNSKYLFIAVLFLIAILAFLVVKPFINAILSSIVLAYLFRPFYKILNKKIHSSISSLIIVLISVLIFVVPIIFISQTLYKESLQLYNSLLSTDINPIFTEILDKIIAYISQESQSLIRSIPRFLINAFITLFLFYYFLKDGEKIVNSVKNLIPMENKHKDIVVREFKRVTSAVVYGLFLIGLLAGVLSTIGFIIFKVPHPFIWGLLTMVVSILPGVGNAVIWLPASLIKILNNDYFNGIGLIIYGLIFISGFEILFKTKLISYKSELHPALIVLGVFGGLALLGFTGLFFGPLILVIFITFLKHTLDKH